MSSVPDVGLHLAPCGFDAAKYAVLHWHYSRSMPAGKLFKVGAWEDGQFIGAVIFGRGANNNIGSPFGLEQVEVCELVRIALTSHHAPTSQIASIAMKMLKRANPGLRLVISYADPEQDHTGTVYQAMNWVYIGRSKAQPAAVVNGNVVHKRTVTSASGTLCGSDYSRPMWKHKYAYPLDRRMRRLLDDMRRPYPRAGSIDSDAPALQAGEGGATPTPALHSKPTHAKH